MKKKLTILITFLLVFCEVKSIDPLTGIVMFGSAATAYVIRKATVKKTISLYAAMKFAKSNTGKRVLNSSGKIIKEDIQKYLAGVSKRIFQPLLIMRQKAQAMLPVSWRAKEIGQATGNPFVAERCKVKPSFKQTVAEVKKTTSQAFEAFKKEEEVIVSQPNLKNQKLSIYPKYVAGATALGSAWYVYKNRKNSQDIDDL
tara:strand:+ start:1376 stop:1975 length:600 start_codon:yes stop_codon:yes gene_type:complete